MVVKSATDAKSGITRPHESRRAIWMTGQVQVFDGGADGVVSTTPNTLFAKHGVFVP